SASAEAPILVLDEPTSALDAQAEHDLFSRLRRLAEGRTTLYISHRFSTVRQADRILLLIDGRLAEEGTHEQLMALDGGYANLFQLQAAAYLDAPLGGTGTGDGAPDDRGRAPLGGTGQGDGAPDDRGRAPLAGDGSAPGRVTALRSP